MGSHRDGYTSPRDLALPAESVTGWNFYVISLGKLLNVAHLLEEESKSIFGDWKGKLEYGQ